jgi:hypothetical protein
MENKGTFTKILAIAGTLLVGFPLLAPILFSAAAFIRGRVFLFDYLMPAELFPLALAGGLLLLWAAIRARAQRAVIGWGLGIAVGLLFGGQALAVVTGLASGATEPTGWRWVLVMGSLIAYILALTAVGGGGILLLMDLYKPKKDL